MGGFGAIIGGIIGGALGGPLGAAAGAVIGSGIENADAETSSSSSNNSIQLTCPYSGCGKTVYINEEGYYNCPHCEKSFHHVNGMTYQQEDYPPLAVELMVMLIAKVAKANGSVTTDVVNELDRILKYEIELNTKSRQVCARIFNYHKNSDDTYMRIYQNIRDEVNADVHDLIMRVVYRLANIDSEMTVKQKSIIDYGAAYLGLDKTYMNEKINNNSQETYCPTCRAKCYVGNAGLYNCHSCKNEFIHNYGITFLEQDFFTNLTHTMVAIFAKLSKANGVVTQNHIKRVDRILKDELELSTEARKICASVFNDSKRNIDTIETDFMRLRILVNKDNVEICFKYFFILAFVDGDVTQEQENYLRKGIDILSDINQLSYQKLYSECKPVASQHYKVLECSEDASFEEVKRSYKLLVHKWHPDKYSGKGLPEEMIKYSQEKFIEIQEAFEAIKKEKSIN